MKQDMARIKLVVLVRDIKLIRLKHLHQYNLLIVMKLLEGVASKNTQVYKLNELKVKGQKQATRSWFETFEKCLITKA